MEVPPTLAPLPLPLPSRSLFREQHAAALARRAPDFSPHLAELAACSQRISAVGAKIGAATIDPRVLPFTYRLLRMPPAARMMQPELRAVTGSLLATVFGSARVARTRLAAAPKGAGANGDGAGQGGNKGGKKGGGVVLQATPFAAPGDHFAVFAECAQLTEGIEAMLAAYGDLVEACAGAAGGCRAPLLYRGGQMPAGDCLLVASCTKVS